MNGIMRARVIKKQGLYRTCMPNTMLQRRWFVKEHVSGVGRIIVRWNITQDLQHHTCEL